MDTPLLGLCASFSSSSEVAMFIASNVSNSATSSSPATTRETPMSIAGTLKNFRLTQATAVGAALSRTYTVYKNGVATAITITLNAGDTSAADTTHQVSFNAGDTLSIHSTATGASTTGIVKWNLLVSAKKKSCLLSAWLNTTASSTAFYNLVQGGVPGNLGTDTSTAPLLSPTAGTISNAYLNSSVAPGAGATMTFTLVKNGVDTAIVVTLSGASATAASDTTHTVSIVATDLLYWRQDDSATQPAAGTIGISLEFDPTVDGESLQMMPQGLNNAAANRFNFLNGSNATTGTEASTQNLMPACSLTKLYVTQFAASGSGKSYVYSTSINGSSTGAPTVTNADSATSGNDTTTLKTVAIGDLVAFKIAPSNSPTASSVKMSVVTYIKPASGYRHTMLSSWRGANRGRHRRIKTNKF